MTDLGVIQPQTMAPHRSKSFHITSHSCSIKKISSLAIAKTRTESYTILIWDIVTQSNLGLLDKCLF